MLDTYLCEQGSNICLKLADNSLLFSPAALEVWSAPIERLFQKPAQPINTPRSKLAHRRDGNSSDFGDLRLHLARSWDVHTFLGCNSSELRTLIAAEFGVRGFVAVLLHGWGFFFFLGRGHGRIGIKGWR